MKKISGLICVAGLLGFSLSSNAQFFNEPTFKFGQVLNYLDRYYVDSVNENKLTESAIVKMLKELDPHSVYMTAKEVKEMNEPLQGNFEGIGVTFNILNDTIFIIGTIPGGPSERIGIMAGDKIVKIDGINVAGIKITNEGVFSKLRGKKGTKVDVSIFRRGVKDLIEFTITRDKIPIFSIEATYMINNTTGYIKLRRFASITGEEFKKALDTLKSQKMENLILDLADNGGGLLDEAVELADHFLDDNKLIVYTKGLHMKKREYRSDLPGLFEKGKLVVLIDEGSASASEILAGAIQDWDRGIIVGRRSFGKGLVQQPCPLQDGSAIRLTIARYYTPSGRLIQKSYDKGSEEYDKDLINRYNKGEYIHEDSIHFPDSLKYYTLVDKRIVYGGGGIMPDFFVPMDTSGYSDYYRDIVRKGTLNKFVLNYIDQNRNQLKSLYPDFNSYVRTFDVEPILKSLIAFAEKDGLKPELKQLNTSRPILTKLLKAYIARDLWDFKEYYQIYNQDESIINKALDVIQNWDARKKSLLNKK
jgi:carboxyl-terminal processing protease